jgi:cysteine desulfurase
MSGRVYLDWNATTPLRPEARAAMAAACDVVGNPSSVHAEGRAARALVEKARAQVAAAVGCLPDEVVFTSGATEAASVLARRPEGQAVFVEPTAHDALWAHHDLTGAERRPDGHTLAMGLANGETGVVTEPGTGPWTWGAHRADRLLLDVTQAVGRLPFAFSWSPAQMAILSAHKFGGPKGVGALVVRQGVDIPPLATGGGQEMGRRSGTENLIGIAGMGAAIEAAARDLADGLWDEVGEKRDALEADLLDGAGDLVIAGSDRPRLPNTSCLVCPGWKGETQVMQMDLAGFAVSAGSACSSGKVRASRVLKAMGYDEVASASAIRVSIGPGVTDDELRRFAGAWLKARDRQRARAA